MLDDAFFTGYRTNLAKKDEVLISIKIPFTSEVCNAFCSPNFDVWTFISKGVLENREANRALYFRGSTSGLTSNQGGEMTTSLS